MILSCMRRPMSAFEGKADIGVKGSYSHSGHSAFVLVSGVDVPCFWGLVWT
jgi:hypothetical protein